MAIAVVRIQVARVARETRLRSADGGKDAGSVRGRKERGRGGATLTRANETVGDSGEEEREDAAERPEAEGRLLKMDCWRCSEGAASFGHERGCRRGGDGARRVEKVGGAVCSGRTTAWGVSRRSWGNGGHIACTEMRTAARRWKRYAGHIPAHMILGPPSLVLFSCGAEPCLRALARRLAPGTWK